MRKLLSSVFLWGILLLSGCNQGDPLAITIDPEHLNVGPEASTATVRTNGFINCTITSINTSVKIYRAKS